MKNVFKTGLLLLAILGLIGCVNDNHGFPTSRTDEQNGPISARLVVSADFGKNTIFDETVDINYAVTALDLLKNNLSVGTAYGGGFITSIEGIKSGYLNQPVQRKDWFLYVNGILTNTGGLDYKIRNGDTIHWYYRDWSFRQAVSALISEFPFAFKYGYSGKNTSTTIWYEDGWLDEAQTVQNYLLDHGVTDIAIRSSQDINPHELQKNHLLIIGSPSFSPIDEINNNWDRLGLFCRFTLQGLEVFDEQGAASQFYTSGTGIILAMQNPFNPAGTGACQNTCFVISGTDDGSISQALNALLYKTDKIKYLAGAIVSGELIIPLPQ